MFIDYTSDLYEATLLCCALLNNVAVSNCYLHF